METTDKSDTCILGSFREKVMEMLDYAGLLPEKYRDTATLYLSQLLQLLHLDSIEDHPSNTPAGRDEVSATNTTMSQTILTNVPDEKAIQVPVADSHSSVDRYTATHIKNNNFTQSKVSDIEYAANDPTTYDHMKQRTGVVDTKVTDTSDEHTEVIRDHDDNQSHCNEDTENLMAELDTFKPESNNPYVKEGTPEAVADDISDVSSLLSFLPQLSPYIKLDIKDVNNAGGSESDGYIHLTVEREDGSVQNLKLGGVMPGAEEVQNVVKNHGDKQMTLIKEQLKKVEKENEPFPDTAVSSVKKEVEKRPRGRPRKLYRDTDVDYGQKSFTCKTCDATLQTHHSLIVHMRCHTGERPFSCSYCGKSFTTKGNMKQHEATHTDDKPWQCSFCNKFFKEKKCLKVHQRQHTGERPFKCNICGKGFSQSGVLKEHLLVHSGLKPHLCDLCGQEFRGSSALRAHRLRHLNQRDFKCDQCDKEFICKNDLQRHLLTHSGAKPYKCAVCGKQFTRLNYLKEHENIHTGNKPFSCTLCKATFTDSMSLHRHKKKHLKQKDDSNKRSYQSELEKELMSGSRQGNQPADDNLPKIEITQQTALGEQTSVQVVLDENTTAEEFQHFHSLVLSAANSADFTLNTSDPAKQIYQVMCVDPDTQELVPGQSKQQYIVTGQNSADFSAMTMLADATAQQYTMQ